MRAIARVAGTEGFTPTQTIAIVLAWVLNLAWMIWLVVVARRVQDLEPRRLANERVGRADKTLEEEFGQE